MKKSMKFLIEQCMYDSIAAMKAIAADEAIIYQIEIIVKNCVDALNAKRKIIFFGNGGSAADAQHLAAELIGRFRMERPGLAAISLTTDTSALTAIGNDYGFDKIFARQLQALGREGDIVFAISTSGNSSNIIEALKVAKEMDMMTFGLSGRSGGAMLPLCDVVLKVPADHTSNVQECHTMLGHIICEMIETSMFG